MTTITTPRKPDFENLLAVLRRKEPSRSTLFEFIGAPGPMLGEEPVAGQGADAMIQNFRCFLENGYDFAVLSSWLTGFLEFPKGERHTGESISQNEGGLIKDEASFEAYPWPDPSTAHYERINDWARLLPPGARFIIMSPSGVLENMTDLVGFEDLCYLIADEPGLVQRVADAIGSRLYTFYERQLEYDVVGAAVVNDDWGFKTQTMLSPVHMRAFIFPWHKRIVKLIHDSGRPAILHSCGNLTAVWDDIIEDIGFDGKHSYEDNILPVEEAYARYGHRIAVLGGLDMDFLCREDPDTVAQRSRSLLEMSRGRGGYALGAGNSIARYVPRESFLAMVRTALE